MKRLRDEEHGGGQSKTTANNGAWHKQHLGNLLAQGARAAPAHVADPRRRRTMSSTRLHRFTGRKLAAATTARRSSSSSLGLFEHTRARPTISRSLTVSSWRTGATPSATASPKRTIGAPRRPRPPRRARARSLRRGGRAEFGLPAHNASTAPDARRRASIIRRPADEARRAPTAIRSGSGGWRAAASRSACRRPRPRCSALVAAADARAISRSLTVSSWRTGAARVGERCRRSGASSRRSQLLQVDARGRRGCCVDATSRRAAPPPGVGSAGAAR